MPSEFVEEIQRWHDQFLKDQERSDYELAQKIERYAANTKRRSGEDGLIYKTHTTEPTAAEQQMQRDAGWNSWLNDALDQRLAEFADNFADLLGGEAGKLENRLRGEIEKLRDEIIELRTNFSIDKT